MLSRIGFIAALRGSTHRRTRSLEYLVAAPSWTVTTPALSLPA